MFMVITLEKGQVIESFFEYFSKEAFDQNLF